MRTYLPDQWLRNWFLGAADDVTYDETQQIGVGTRDSFVKQLASVWRRVASVCHPEAQMVVRFGALPSLAADPTSVIRESFNDASAGWQVVTSRSVDVIPKAKRQASQFVHSLSAPLIEVDVYARLEA